MIDSVDPSSWEPLADLTATLLFLEHSFVVFQRDSKHTTQISIAHSIFVVVVVPDSRRQPTFSSFLVDAA